MLACKDPAHLVLSSLRFGLTVQCTLCSGKGSKLSVNSLWKSVNVKSFFLGIDRRVVDSSAIF